MPMKEQETGKELAEKGLALFIEDYGLDAEDEGRARDFMEGRIAEAPAVRHNPSYYGFKTLDILPRLSREGDDALLRLGAMMLSNQQNYWIPHVFSGMLGWQFEVARLSQDLFKETKRVDLLEGPISQLIRYIDKSKFKAIIQEYLEEGGAGIRRSNNIRMMIPGLMLARFFVKLCPEHSEELLENLSPLIRAVVEERSDEVGALLKSMLEGPIVQRSDLSNRYAFPELNEQWLKQRRAQASAEWHAGSGLSSEAAVSRQQVEEALGISTSLLLYRVYYHGSKRLLLNNPKEIDVLLLKAVRLLHEVYPFEVRNGLLELDGHYSKVDAALEGLVPLDAPFAFIEQAWDLLNSRSIPWSRLKTHVLADPETSLCAYTILKDPFFKLVLVKLLSENDIQMPEEIVSIEQRVLQLMNDPSYAGRYGLALSRYLQGGLSLEQYRADRDNGGLFNKLGKNQHRVRLIIAMTFLPPESAAMRRLAALITQSGVNTRECLSELYRSDAFSGELLLSLHGDAPEVDDGKLLEALILLNGWNIHHHLDLNRVPDEEYRRLLEKHLAFALKFYSELSNEARGLIVEIALDKHVELSRDLLAEVFLTGLNDSSKKLRRSVMSAFSAIGDLELYRTVYAAEKKSSVKELIISLLRRLTDGNEVLEELLKNEKNSGLRQLLQTLVDTAGQGPAKAHAALARQANDKKLAKLEWLHTTVLPPLLDHEGQPLDDEIAMYLLQQSIEYTSAPNELLEELREYVHSDSLARFSEALIGQWLEGEAPAKDKWVLYIGALFGDRKLIPLLGDSIKRWVENGRGAIAAEAVKLLSYINETSALIAIDHIRRSIKNKQVKGAAEEALLQAAENADLTQEQLADRLVASLGFDKHGLQSFSYGSRSFQVKVTRDHQLAVVQEGTGKTLKSLPAPGEKDDAALAAEAKSRFAQLKKDLKKMAAIQLQRLEESLSKQRLWSAEEWSDLFVGNIIMRQFAVGLIWGIYAEGQLKQTFRYMDDGTFNTVDEEEYQLSSIARIGLVHPLELDEELLNGWRSQLCDYEVAQPFKQLERAVHMAEQEDRQLMLFQRLPGEEFSPTALQKTLEKYGWIKGLPQDGGFYYEFFKEYGDLVAELQFSGTSVTYYDGLENITLQGLSFYANKGSRRHYYYNEQPLAIGDVPDRVFSETLLDILRAAGR